MYRNKDPTEWSPWPDFVREQFAAAEQMQQNITQWHAQKKAAMQRGDFAEAKRLERLIEIFSKDIQDKTEQIRQLVKRGDAP